MKVIDDDDEIFPPRNIELTNIFRTAISWTSMVTANGERENVSMLSLIHI